MAIRDKDDSEERQAFGDSSFSSYGHPWWAFLHKILNFDWGHDEFANFTH
jgi:succinate-acetate transporter protein